MVRFFVKKHMAVFSACVMIVALGIIAYINLPRESSPELKQPWIFVTTTYPGVSAIDIENLVTRVIEQEIDGLEGLDEITSTSRQGVSSIEVTFTSDVTTEVALDRVKEKVDLAKASLPADANDSIVNEFKSSDWPIFIAVLSHEQGLEPINAQAEKLRDELRRVPGVLDALLSGELEKELAVELDPSKLEHYGFSIDNVINAIRSENITIPGGILKNHTRVYSLAVTGEIEEAELFEDIIVSANGKKVKLRELGTVRFQNKEPEKYTRINGVPAISISITKKTGSNSIRIIENIKRIIEDVQSSWPEGTIVTYSWDESRDIKMILADLENNMFTGFILVIIVTLFFLGKTNSLFVSLAIPFSMLMSFFILQLMGITLNMVVLFSLILALGMLVDNGIVIVENIFRHAGMGKSKSEASIDGSHEVAGPIIASTITTCLAFLPILFMPGIMGDFMSFVPKTVIVVLICSLVVALSINPVFCASFLSISEKNRKKIVEGSGLFVKFQNWYERKLKGATKFAGRTILISLAVVVVGFIMFGLFAKDPIFFPALDPSSARMTIETPQGTPLDTTDGYVKQLEEIVVESPASLDNYQSTTGTGAPHKASIRIVYRPFSEREIKGEAAVRELKKRVRDFTGPLVKIEESEEGFPTGNDISYGIIGNDYTVLGQISDSILKILKKYSGSFKMIDSDYEAASPEFRIEIDREKAARYGLSTMKIASTIRNAMQGANVGTFKQGEDEYDIIVRYEDSARDSLNTLLNLKIIAGDDKRIPLSSVIKRKPKEEASLGIIKRRDINRSVEVWADFVPDFPERNTIIQEIDVKVDELKQHLPEGYLITTGSGLDLRTESEDFLIIAFVVAIFLILIVLIAQFNSVIDPFIIIVSVFLSIGGVMWGFALFGLFNGMAFVIIMSGIGCIALAGVAVNNCIVLVDYTNILIKDRMPWRKAVVEAGKIRLRPVILTALTTVLALFPMALGVSFDIHTFGITVGSESSEYWKGFAWTMLFGLSFATFMTLIIVPSLLAFKFRIQERLGVKIERT